MTALTDQTPDLLALEDVVDNRMLRDILKGTAEMAASGEDPSSVLEQLQRAVEDHEAILRRQAALIKRLKEELKGVTRNG